jgi:uncharacterized protein
MKVFADTYALVAHWEGRPAYRSLANEEPVTTALNLLELGQVMLRRRAPHVTEVLAAWQPRVVEPDPSIPLEAARFRLERQEAGADCSTVDVWGYATARHLGIPFLTGDRGFRGVPGVKFLKA